MATIGNLELRIEKDILYASCTHDGDRAYEIIQMLSEFLDSTERPTAQQYKSWFRKTSEEILPYNYCEELIGGVPHKVIINVGDKVILHTTPHEEFSDILREACNTLTTKHKYRILEYSDLEIGEQLSLP